jgi:hypothetical protein
LSGHCFFRPLPFFAVAFRVIASGGLNRSFIIHFSLGDHRSQITQFCGHEPVCRQFSNPIGCKTFKSWTFLSKEIIRNHSNPRLFKSGHFNIIRNNSNWNHSNPGLFKSRTFQIPNFLILDFSTMEFSTSDFSKQHRVEVVPGLKLGLEKFGGIRTFQPWTSQPQVFQP